MANKLLSVFNVGGVDYNLKDAAATAKLTTLLGEHAVEALGAAAWKALAASISDTDEGLPTAKSVKAYVDAQVGKVHNFDVVLDPTGTTAGPSVAASADTMYKIYLVPDTNAEAGSYIEYITIKDGETYSWEAIGSTRTSLTGYVEKTQKIAGLTLNKDITVAELQGALGLKAFAYAATGTATVASKTVSGVKATGTSAGSLTGDIDYTSELLSSNGVFKPAGDITGDAIKGGSIEVALKDATTASEATVIAGAYKPQGTVATTFTTAVEGAENAVSFNGDVSKPTATVTPTTVTIKSMKTPGTAYSITEGSVAQAADTKSAFATEGITASVNEDTETLTFVTAGTSDAVTAAGAVTYTAPALSGALPTFDEGTKVMTDADVDVSKPTFTPDKYSVSSSFDGQEEANMKVSKVTYLKQVVDTDKTKTKFTPVPATLGFAGISGAVQVSAKYDRATKGTLAFTPAALDLDVGDITVPEQTVTVNPVTDAGV